MSRATGPLILVLAGWIIVFLAENARIPVDDPNTHLELTMIHEVMVLDHSGRPLALVLYGASLKLLVLGALIVGPLLPRTGRPWAGLGRPSTAPWRCWPPAWGWWRASPPGCA